MRIFILLQKLINGRNTKHFYKKEELENTDHCQCQVWNFDFLFLKSLQMDREMLIMIVVIKNYFTFISNNDASSD